MKNKNSFCPRNNKCLTLCFTPTALSFLLIGMMFLCDLLSVGKIVLIIMSCILLLVGLVFIVFSIKSWNAPLVFFDEKIEQIKFGKKYTWYFKNMVDIKVKAGRPTRYSSTASLLIITFSDTKHNLEIEMFSKCYQELLKRCRTYPIYEKICEKCTLNGQGTGLCPNFRRKNMDFANINKQFMLISKNKYEIVDIKEADFIPTITNVLICFVVNTDIDKSNFLKEKYDECCEEYLSFVKQFEQYRTYTYEFMLLSKEEVKRDYDGNFYYAMH